MKLTEKWLKKKDACSDSFAWWKTNGADTVEATVENLLKSDEAEKYSWSNWLLTNKFTKEQNVKFAIFAARSVLKIYEDKYPDDLRPRKAIEAAENYLKTKSKAAWAAVEAFLAAWAAAWAAWAAGAARDAAYKKMQEKIIGYGLDLLNEKG